MIRIDAHHHLWRYTAEEFGWIDDGMAVLRRDYLLNELRAEMAGAGVSAAVAVQARQTVEETRWLLELAGTGSPIAGVVGWLPIAAPEFPTLLDEFSDKTALKGLRHVVQAEDPGFLDGDAFNRGIAALQTAGRGKEMVYDLLIVARQLDEAIRFVDRHPQQAFVVDHLAKPAIAAGEIDIWRAGIWELARRPHVTCKVSGMVTEADPQRWTPQELKPYFDIVLEAFGPQRLMAGTDWPVLTVGCRYRQWWQIVEEWVTPLTHDEQAAILGGTVERIYRL